MGHLVQIMYKRPNSFQGCTARVLRAIAETQKVGMRRGKGMGHRADAPELILKEWTFCRWKKREQFREQHV